MQLLYTGSEEDGEANEDFVKKSEDAALSTQYEEQSEDPRMKLNTYSGTSLFWAP